MLIKLHMFMIAIVLFFHITDSFPLLQSYEQNVTESSVALHLLAGGEKLKFSQDEDVLSSLNQKQTLSVSYSSSTPVTPDQDITPNSSPLTTSVWVPTYSTPVSTPITMLRNLSTTVPTSASLKVSLWKTTSKSRTTANTTPSATRVTPLSNFHELLRTSSTTLKTDALPVISSTLPPPPNDIPSYILSHLHQPPRLPLSHETVAHHPPTPTSSSASNSLSGSPHPPGVLAVPQGCLPPPSLFAEGGYQYVLSLQPQSTVFQYAVPVTHVPPLHQITICLRFQVSSLSRPNFLFSYAAERQDNAMMVFVSPATNPGIGFYVNNVRVKARHPLQLHVWYSSCVTWDSHQGRFAIYLNGEMIKNGKKKCPRCRVKGGGVIVLGQEQDHVGGGFNTKQVLHGHLNHLNLWSVALPHSSLLPYLRCDSPTSLTSQNSSSGLNLPSNSHGEIPVEGSRDSGEDTDEHEFNSQASRIIWWGRTPLSVTGGALLTPLYYWI